VLDSCRVLEGEGFEVTYLPVLPTGLIDLDSFQKAIRPNTVLTSVMAVNNEIGVIQPLAEIGVYLQSAFFFLNPFKNLSFTFLKIFPGAICRKSNIFFHTDAAQAVGKIHLDVNAMNIDLMSISGHKLYGPKGLSK